MEVKKTRLNERIYFLDKVRPDGKIICSLTSVCWRKEQTKGKATFDKINVHAERTGKMFPFDHK